MANPSCGGVSRREFIKSTTAGAAATAGLLHGLPESAEAASRTRSERPRLGVIGCGAWGQVHLNALVKLEQERRVEIVAVCDVFNKHLAKAVERVRRTTRHAPRAVADYRELLDDPALDVLLIAAPNHWHATMTAAALRSGKHVYCETPLLHRLDEADLVLRAWRDSDRVLQVGVQRLSDGRFRAAGEFVRAGGIGAVVHAQTECFRNSSSGQWRSAGLSREMTPANVHWPLFLGSHLGLAPELPFDRALFAQWRCYWPFSQGPFSDLFAPRVTQMIAALGVREPLRVTAAGGIFLEQDGRDVPDTATMLVDYAEGLQVVATSTLCNDHALEQCIRGRHGTIVFDNGRDGFDVLPQRPPSAGAPMPRKLHVSAPRPKDEVQAHWENFLSAVAAGDPSLCHCPPDLAAAAASTTLLAADSYRRGKVLTLRDGRAVDAEERTAPDGDFAARQVAPARSADAPRAPAYQKLAGPWPNDRTDPAA